MPIKRSLTKKLQKLTTRSRSGSLSQSGVSSAPAPLSELEAAQTGCDHFYSIAFEQTDDHNSSGGDDLCSISSNIDSAGSIRDPATPRGSSEDPCSALVQTSHRLFAQNLTTTSSSATTTSSSSSSITTPVSTPGLTMSSSANSPVSRGDTMYHYYNKRSSDAMQMYPTNSGGIGGITPMSIPHHQQKPSVSSSCYSPTVAYGSPTFRDESFFIVEGDGSFVQCDSQMLREEEKRTLEEDAKADEMAMHILEKVSADDYLRELRTGSWYI